MRGRKGGREGGRKGGREVGKRGEASVCHLELQGRLLEHVCDRLCLQTLSGMCMWVGEWVYKYIN